MKKYIKNSVTYTVLGRYKHDPVELTENEFNEEYKRHVSQGFIPEEGAPLVLWKSDDYGNMLVEFMEV